MGARIVGLGVLLCWLACEGEPTTLCDSEQVFWSVPDDVVSPADDSSADPGIQIDITLHTSLMPGFTMTLYLGSEPVSGPVVVDEEGAIHFENVSLPYGSVQLMLRGRNQCKEVKSSKSIFVFDEQGDISCQMALAGATLGAGGIENWPASADADAMAADFQGPITVTTGREDVTVTLLVLDVMTGIENSLHEEAASGGQAVFIPTFSPGRYALRATCEWHVISVPRYSSTHTVDIDAAP